MSSTRTWPLQEAKNKFSQVAEEAVQYGPQVVTKRGKAAVIILSVDDYKRLRKPKNDLVQFLVSSPLPGSGLDVARSGETGRDAAL